VVSAAICVGAECGQIGCFHCHDLRGGQLADLGGRQRGGLLDGQLDDLLRA
jgi:hypothetical protein